jgi:hypothetical protein
MSVIMTLWFQGDPRKLEEYAAANADELRGIGETAKGYGAIAHRFYGSDDGQIMVLDEWPDPQSFQSFFEGTRDRIGPLMETVGASSEPEIRFWRKLDTGDDIGWEG